MAGEKTRAWSSGRHAVEKALRKFAHEASLMTDGGVILERAACALHHRADASAVNFALYDGIGR